MIDKAEQRRRAQEMSQTLAAQGQQAPKLTYPTSTPPQPKPSKVMQQLQAIGEANQRSKRKPMLDVTGRQLEIGDQVVTTVDCIVSELRVGRVIGFTETRVKVSVNVDRARPGTFKTIAKGPKAVAKV